MTKWFATGQRVHIEHPRGQFRNGTIIVARGDYSDVQWDNGVVQTVYNGYLTLTPDPALAEGP